MTLRVWPVAVPLDPDARVLPAPLAATLAGAGPVAPVILLVGGPAATSWAPGAAVALAEGWSRDGLRIVLTDLSVEAPVLHELVGEPNDEGLADVFFYGASLRRVIRTAGTRGFGFIPAGTAPAGEGELLTHPAWRQVVAHFFRDGAVLLAYVPAAAPGLAALAARLGAVIALAPPSDLDALEAVLPSDASVLALIEPPAAVPAPTATFVRGPESAEADVAATPVLEAQAAGPAVAAAEPAAAAPAEPEAPPASSPEPTPVRRPAGARTKSDARVDALWAHRQNAQRIRVQISPVDLVPGRKVTEAELLSEPPPLAQEPVGRRRGLSLILWLLLGAAVALGAILGVQYYLGGRIPLVDSWLGRTPAPARPATKAPPANQGASGQPSATGAAGALAPEGAADQGAPGAPPDSLPYSVAIAAYPGYVAAVERATQLTREQSQVGFFVTPVRHGAAIYYHVMAGPVADSVGAAALMRRLLDAGVKTGSSQWDIVSTRLAFNLGDYPSRSEAEQRGAALAPRDIPTYVVEVPTPGGPSRWRLYAGAFQGVADAATLRPVLKSAGVPDSLVTRIGRPGR